MLNEGVMESTSLVWRGPSFAHPTSRSYVPTLSVGLSRNAEKHTPWQVAMHQKLGHASLHAVRFVRRVVPHPTIHERPVDELVEGGWVDTESGVVERSVPIREDQVSSAFDDSVDARHEIDDFILSAVE